MTKESLMIQKINKTREYLDYLEEHYNNVQKAWKVVQEKCKDLRFIYDDYFFFTIDYHVKGHDISKLSKNEFIQYREKFYKADTEVVEEADFDLAWEYHKLNNPHHWENWTAASYGHYAEWEINCVHMILDWIAVGYMFNNTAQAYYEKIAKEINLPDYAVEFIYEIFDRVYGDN
jgi:hypothetical protein